MTGTDRSKRRLARALGWLLLMSWAGWTSVAHAESGPQERAAAEMLFQDAKRLMKTGKVPEACRKLEESQRLDPRAGTLLALAVCHKNEGKIATAWVEFREALSLAKKAGRMDRVSLAQKEIAAIEPKLPRLAIVVPAASLVPGLVLRRDGEELGPPLWDTAVPVDPGEHQVSASAPGRKAWEAKVTVAEGDEAKVSIPMLQELPKPVAPPPAPPPPAPRPRTAAWLAGGVGVVAVGVGVGYGVRAIAKRSSSDEHCRGSLCDPQGVELNEQAKSAATVSNVAFGVGVLGLGVATWLFLSGNSEPKPAASRAPLRVAAVPEKRGAAILVQAAW